MLVTATTGIAAMALNRFTAYSAFGIIIKNTVSPLTAAKDNNPV